MAQKLRFFPLGGLGETGKNMTVYDYGRNVAEELIEASRAEIKRQDQHGAHNVRRVLEDFFYRETQLRPVVLLQFIEV